MPPEAAEFVGRGSELATLTADDAARPGVAVIEGMPGVGKTTLAVRAARLVRDRYPDGTIYLNLHSHDPGSPALDQWPVLLEILGKGEGEARYLSVSEVRTLFVERRFPKRITDRLQAPI